MNTAKKISSNQQDRFILSSSVMEYAANVKDKFPLVHDSLKTVRSMLANDLSCLC